VVKKYHTDLPDELSKEFDKIVDTYYLKDAEAVRDAIRRMVFEFKGMGEVKDQKSNILNKNQGGGLVK